jgi:secondary thiamine-phosphate synthase enzyme
MHQKPIEVRTTGRGFTDITEAVAQVVSDSRIANGLCTIFIRHTSASLVIQENADPAVLRDLGRWLEKMAPESRDWEHDDEGPDDMPAHARSALLHTHESIPVIGGMLALGRWQAIYLAEHRAVPHTRALIVHVQGETA